MSLIGLLAFFIYRSQLHAKKVEAAQVLLDEILEAETALAEIKSLQDQGILKITQGTALLPGPIPDGNWTSLRHALARVLDHQDKESLTDFYSSCAVVQRAIDYMKERPFRTAYIKNELFQKEVLEVYKREHEINNIGLKTTENKESTVTKDMPESDAKDPNAYLTELFWRDDRDYWISLANDMILQVLNLPLLEKSVCKRKLEVVAGSKFWPFTRLKLWMIGRKNSVR